MSCSCCGLAHKELALIEYFMHCLVKHVLKVQYELNL